MSSIKASDGLSQEELGLLFGSKAPKNKESCYLILSEGEASDCNEKKSDILSMAFNVNTEEFTLNVNMFGASKPDIDESFLLTYSNGVDDSVMPVSLTQEKSFKVKVNKDNNVLSSATRLVIHSSTFRTSCTFEISVQEDVLNNTTVTTDANGSYIALFTPENEFTEFSYDSFDYSWYLNDKKVSISRSSNVNQTYIRENGVDGVNKLVLKLNGSIAHTEEQINHVVSDFGLVMEQQTVIDGYKYWYNIIPYESTDDDFTVKMYKNNQLIPDNGEAFTDNPNDKFQLVAFHKSENVLDVFDRGSVISYSSYIEKEIEPKDITEVLKSGFSKAENNQLVREYDGVENMSIEKTGVLPPDISDKYLLEYRIEEDPLISALKISDSVGAIGSNDIYGPDDDGLYYYSDKDGNSITVPLKQSIEKVVEVLDLEENYVASTISDFDNNNIAQGDVSKMSITDDGFMSSNGLTVLTRNFQESENLSRVQFEYVGSESPIDANAEVKIEFYRADDTIILSAGVKPKGDLSGWIVYGDGEDILVNSYLYHRLLNVPLQNHMDIAKMNIFLSSKTENAESDSILIKDFIMTIMK